MAVISSDDAADEERWIRYGSAPLIATLLLPIIIGAILLLKCVFTHCCVRKTTTKDEMYGLEGRMTMLTTADSNFAQLTNSNTATPASSSSAGNSSNHRTKSSPIGISKRNSSDGETEVKVGHHHNSPGTCSSVVEKAPANAGNNDNVIEGSPNSSVYNGESRLTMEYRRSSGASRLTSSQDSSELAGSLKRASAQHRQLPDLPQTPAGGATSHPARRSSSVLSHDGTSELYATVGETPLPEGSSSKRSSHYAQIRENPLASSSGKVSLSTSGSLPVVNGVPPGSSSGASAVLRTKGIEATPSSDSETYASTSLHHPYAKLKKNPTEHPYARVRPAGSNNNDEETDTDNYDLPQFLTRQVVGASASTGTGIAGGASSSQNRPSSSGTIQSSVGGVVGSSADAEGPVPPRRVGRQWRRSSQPQVLNNDNSSHFSGDSQDSRGYTSISVREPLSNIRNQVVANTRSYDSHYATVSDDSEEMYAAIDDSNESNYMRIPGDHDNNNSRRPTWLGGPNVSSPIPERREANSPLPPVPNVPPPDLSPGPPSSTSSVIPPPSSPNAQLPQVPIPSPQTASSAHPPVYAQVTKKKKQQQQGKVPVTPTASNASTSSSQQIMMREAPLGSETPLPPPPPPPVKESSTSHQHSSTSSSSHYSHQPLYHRSKRAASLMDNSNPMDADTVDSRRWSKADISYSEFEVVRENLFPSPSATNNANIAITDDPPHHHHLLRSPGSGRSDVSPSSSSAIRQQDLVDEDNYNIIPEKTLGAGRSSRQSTSTTTSITTAPIVGGGGSGGARIRLDSGNYHEIEPRNLNNTYQEIGGGKEPSDHYQEICDHRRLEDEDDDDDDDGGELYQVIDKKKINSDEDDDEEEEEDQFYERVKKPGTQSKGKKHGYEKIKKKDPSSSSSSSKRPGNLSRVKPALGSDEDEDEDDDKPDQLYESVKYPPYERLKESKDDLLDSEDGKNGSDYYEDIGYSRVKPKTRPKSKTPEQQQDALSRHREERDSTRSTSSSSAVVAGGIVHSPQQDVSQLYAQVDKTKKRTKKSGATTISTMVGPPSLAAPDNTIQDISGNNNEPLTMPLYSKVNKAAKNKSTNKNSGTGGGGGGGLAAHQDNNHVDQGNRGSATNDNSIEYI